MTSNTDSKRLEGIELLRIICAFGIIVFHNKAPGAEIAYAALPAFIALSVYFSMAWKPSASLRDFASSRFYRLLIPWLFWSGVFSVQLLATARLNGQELSAVFHPWQLLAGPYIHLWFIPYVAFVGFLFRGLRLRILQLPETYTIVGCVGLAALTFVVQPVEWLGPPFTQWINGGPAVLMAVAFFRAETRIAYLLTAFLLSSVCIVAIALQLDGGPIQLLLALIAIFGAINLNIPESRTLSHLASLTLGVYILHSHAPMVLFEFGYYAWDQTLLSSLLIFATSLAITAVLKLIPILRHTV